MVSDIKGPDLSNNLRSGQPERKGQSTSPELQPQTEAPAEASDVKLSTTAKELQQLQEATDDITVQQAKIDELRAALANGQDIMDPKLVAQKMLDMEP